MPDDMNTETDARQSERALTPAEARRTEAFARICDEMRAQGRRRHDLTIDIVQANVLALVVSLLPIALVGILYLALNPLDGLVAQAASWLDAGFGPVFLGVAGFTVG